MESLKTEYYEILEEEKLPNLEMTFDQMEEDLESIKVDLQTLLLKHDVISKNESICNTALSNNDYSKSLVSLNYLILVLLKEENLRSSTWPKGRIQDVVTGKDGKVRVVMVHLGLENGNLDSDFRNSLNFFGYGRNYSIALRSSPASVVLFPIATKLSGVALRKYDQQKIALTISSSGIAATLLSSGQMHIKHFCCH
ncbi:uncharacterized protein TNCV_143481 [Trichonephila clavipes]|nr:uncharacterized protein TNCV_143481 [Trichonephila clavipes]